MAYQHCATNVISLLNKNYPNKNWQENKKHKIILSEILRYLGSKVLCLDNEIKIIFPCSQISNMIEDIFHSHLGEDNLQIYPVLWHLDDIGHKIPRLMTLSTINEVYIINTYI